MFKKFVFLALLLFLLPWGARAQYVLMRGITVGGCSLSSAPGLKLWSTLGQPLVGTATSPQNQLRLGFWQANAGILTGILIPAEAALPLRYELQQNYPNPFNPSTTIAFAVPEPTRVSLTVFNLCGQEVATLADRKFLPGRYRIVWNAAGRASGVYFYRLRANGFVAVRKMLLEK